MNSSLWTKYSLEELSLIIFSGGTPDTRKPEYWDGEYNWLSSGETSNTFITKTNQTITQLGIKESSTRLAKKGDIVIASAGQGFTRGQASLCKIDTYINQSIVSIRCNGLVANNFYVFYNLKSRYEELRQISDGHSIRGSLTTKMMKSFEILLPSLNTQKSIANILSSLDEKIELNNKINKNLEEIAQTLYKRWFVDFEFPNKNGEPYKSSGGEMVDSELGMIPKGWEVMPLESRFAFERGIEPGSKNYLSSESLGTVRFFRVGDLNKTNNVFVKKDLVKNKFTKFNDVLVSFDGAIGRVETGFEGSYSTGLRKVYDEKGLLDNSFVYFLMKSQLIQDTMAAHANGTTILHAGSSIPHLIIPFNEVLVEKFVQIINPIFYKLLTLKKETATLIKTRDELLPKLMSGEIEVPVEE